MSNNDDAGTPSSAGNPKLSAEQRAILEDADAWRVVERAFANNYGPQITAMEARLAALETGTESLREGSAAVSNLRIEMIKRIRLVQQELEGHIRQVVDASESGSVKVSTVDSMSERVTSVQTRLNELIAGKIAIETASSSGVSKEVDARLDQLKVEINRVETALNAAINLQRTEAEDRQRSLQTQLQASIDALSSKLNANFDSLEARLSAVEESNNTSIRTFEATLLALQSNVTDMEERVVDRVSTQTVELNFSRFESKVVDLDMRLSRRIDEQSEDLALRFQGFNAEWLDYNARYSAWVRAQLKALKGCITDREILHKLLVEMAARIEVTHAEAPCIVDEPAAAPGWTWTPPDLGGLEGLEDGPEVDDGPSGNSP